VTKAWSKKDYPSLKIGYFILNRNPVNYHAQIEQISLDPSNIGPGIGLSPDRMPLLMQTNKDIESGRTTDIYPSISH
jgi:catalase